jgi:hypothetical protein
MSISGLSIKNAVIQTTDGQMFKGITHSEAYRDAVELGKITEKNNKYFNDRGEEIDINWDLFEVDISNADPEKVDDVLSIIGKEKLIDRLTADSLFGLSAGEQLVERKDRLYAAYDKARAEASQEEFIGEKETPLYHGTVAEELNFGEQPIGNQLPFGVHFTPDKEIAHSFLTGESKVKPTSGDGRIIETTMPKNPLNINKGLFFKGSKEFEILKEIAEKSQIDDTQIVFEYKDPKTGEMKTAIDPMNVFWKRGKQAKLDVIKDVLERNGYDKAILYGMRGTVDPMGVGSPVYTPAVAILDAGLITHNYPSNNYNKAKAEVNKEASQKLENKLRKTIMQRMSQTNEDRKRQEFMDQIARQQQALESGDKQQVAPQSMPSTPQQTMPSKPQLTTQLPQQLTTQLPQQLTTTEHKVSVPFPEGTRVFTSNQPVNILGMERGGTYAISKVNDDNTVDVREYSRDGLGRTMNNIHVNRLYSATNDHLPLIAEQMARKVARGQPLDINDQLAKAHILNTPHNSPIRSAYRNLLNSLQQVVKQQCNDLDNVKIGQILLKKLAYLEDDDVMVDLTQRTVPIPKPVKNKIMRQFHAMGDHFVEIPLDEMENILAEHDIIMIQEDGTIWSGMLLGDKECGEEGAEHQRASIQLAIKKDDGQYYPAKTWLHMTWCRLSSGRMEVIKYVS